jgi:hypothetical protein
LEVTGERWKKVMVVAFQRRCWRLWPVVRSYTSRGETKGLALD